MTRKEAVNWLINIMADIGKAEHRELWHYEQALSEIRELLEAQPEVIACGSGELIVDATGDLVSRAAAIDTAIEAADKWDGGYSSEREGIIRKFFDKLPAAQPDHVADVSKKVDRDCISRKAVVKFFNDWISCLDENCHHQSVADMTIIKNDFKNLPSAQPEQVCVATVALTDEQVKEVVEKAKNAVVSVIEPERKRGEWIVWGGMDIPENHGRHICSLCGEFAPVRREKPLIKEYLSDFCPNCGADMRKENES